LWRNSQIGASLCNENSEVPVKDVKTMLYGKWHNSMLPGRIVSRVLNPLKFARLAFFKTDLVATLLSHYDPNQPDRKKGISE